MAEVDEPSCPGQAVIDQAEILIGHIAVRRWVVVKLVEKTELEVTGMDVRKLEREDQAVDALTS